MPTELSAGQVDSKVELTGWRCVLWVYLQLSPSGTTEGDVMSFFFLSRPKQELCGSLTLSDFCCKERGGAVRTRVDVWWTGVQRGTVPEFSPWREVNLIEGGGHRLHTTLQQIPCLGKCGHAAAVLSAGSRGAALRLMWSGHWKAGGLLPAFRA